MNETSVLLFLRLSIEMKYRVKFTYVSAVRMIIYMKLTFSFCYFVECTKYTGLN